MATLPISGTNIRLLSGVPFSNDYKHTRWFDSQSEQTTYFLAKPTTHTMSDSTFQRIEGRNYIKANKSIDQLWGTNYVMFQNANYNAKWFYGFVTKLEYMNDSMTKVFFEIDVFQTWKFELTFKTSYVEREHCSLWLSSNNPVINTVDEGLNYGIEYETKEVNNYNVASDIMYLVIVTKSTVHSDDVTDAGLIKANVNAVPQPLSTYIHPFDSFGNSPDVIYDGGTHSLSSVIEVLNSIYQLDQSVNNIVSLYITNHVGLDASLSSGDLVINWNTFQNLQFVSVGGTFNTIYVERMLSYPSTEINCQPKYSGLTNNITESKLLMYPYSYVELTDFKGNTTSLKLEYINSNDIVIDVFGSMGYSNKVAYIPKNYLAGSSVPSGEKIMSTIGKGLIDNAPNDVAVITDMLAAFFQGNRNSLHNQADMITFNGKMDVYSGAASGGANLMGLNFGGGVAGIEKAVRGGQNAVYQIEGLQAKVKDIDNTPPQLSKMGSNTAFDFGNGYRGFWLVSKQITDEYKEKLQGFWNMFGYKVNEVKIPNFHTRRYWNYIKTVSCVVLGSINNEDLDEYKTIFDNGITLWHTDDVGNYFYSNEVI